MKRQYIVKSVSFSTDGIQTQIIISRKDRQYIQIFYGRLSTFHPGMKIYSIVPMAWKGWERVA